ncbi:hypothetical protein DL768_011003 [Monosporascus sp. mg162]|nr:hypothetical protein DL768_011003 [Monosporascus sp. mg162]
MKSPISPYGTAGRIDGVSSHLFTVVWKTRDAIAADTSADDAILTQLNRRRYSDNTWKCLFDYADSLHRWDDQRSSSLLARQNWSGSFGTRSLRDTPES